MALVNDRSIQGYYGLRNLYAIYPSPWKESWGRKPCLGTVRADSVHFAKYAAYDNGLMPLNGSVEPEPILLKRKKAATPQPSKE